MKNKHERIMSGDYSRDMWDLINDAKTVSDLSGALYLVCCRLQELEGRFSEPDLEKGKNMNTFLGKKALSKLGLVLFLGTAFSMEDKWNSPTDIIYVGSLMVGVFLYVFFDSHQ